MLERAIVFGMNAFAYTFLYGLPRLVHSVVVALPSLLKDILTGRPLFSFFRRQRQVRIIAADAAARAVFGVPEQLSYGGPLYNGHVHTILGAARLPRRVAYERELLTAKDGNPICLDWLKLEGEAARAAKGLLLVVPGLANYCQTNYVQRLAREARRRGYHCCILTPRGMGSAPLTTPNITCVTFTDDYRQLLRERFARRRVAEEFGAPLPVVAVGYSCGATTLIKTVAEEEEAMRAGEAHADGFPLDAIVSMTAPSDMEVSANALRTRVARALYARPIYVALQKYLRKHRACFLMAAEGKTPEEVARLPLINRDVDAALRAIKEPRDVDVMVVAPIFGYESNIAYYADGYAGDLLRRVRATPTLYVSCADDPMVGCVLPPAEWRELCAGSPRLVYLEYPTGGHFGFVQGPLAELTRDASPLQTIPLDFIDRFLANRGGAAAPATA